MSSQCLKACSTDLNDTIFGLHFPTPPTDSQIQADPSLKEKTWHLNWIPLAFPASFQPQRQLTRFTSEIWVNFFCPSLGAPIPLLRAHCVTRTQYTCQDFVLDQYGDHVLTCKKHTGAIAGHDHVMKVSAQLARNSGLRVRFNRKVTTIAADNNKNKVMYKSWSLSLQDMMIWYGMCLLSVMGSAAARRMASMVSCNSETTLMLRLASRLIDTDVIMLSRTLLSHL